MKRIFLLILLVFWTAIAFAQSTDAALTTQSNVIRDETVAGANTKTRIAAMYQAIIDSKVNRGELITASGTNTYTATGATGLTLSVNFLVVVKFTNANTGASTLNITPSGGSALGAVAIKKNVSTALAAGDIAAGQVFLLIYDGTNFQLVGGSGGSSTYTSNTRTASYPLVLTDAQTIVEMNVASANNVTVPLNSSVAFPVGTEIVIAQYGAGLTTVVATGGVTINSSSGSLDSPGQYSVMVLRKRATDEWYLWNGTSGGGGGITSPTLGGTGIANNSASTITITGAYPTTLTLSGSTGVTLPTSGTLATLAGSESLTNKKLGSLTTNGFVKTGSGDGTLSVDASSYFPTTLTGSTTITQAGFNTSFSGIGKVTFSPTSTNPGLNFGSYAGNPGSLANGDMWYNSTSNYYGMYVNGGLSLILNSSTIGTNQIPYYAGGAVPAGQLSASSDFTFSNTNNASGLTLARKVSITHKVQTSAWVPVLSVTGGAHTGMTASTAFVSQDFVGATQTWGSGTIAVQPFSYFRAYTLAGTSGTNTATIAATIQVDPTVVGTNAAITNNYTVYHTGKEGYDATITAGGTTGNQTINKPSGTVNIAAAGTSVTVTNSMVTTSSIVHCVIRTNDATAYIKNVVPGAGSFVITLGAAATAEVSIGFIVFN